MMKLIFVLLFTNIFFLLFAQLPQQGWEFNPPSDQFTSDALLDLRFLNEDYAGQNGFVTLSPDHNSFVSENGKPIRFWAINGASEANNMNNTELARYARFLSKMGVNVIRYHGSIHPVNATDPFDKANSIEINNIQRVVAAMKKEGIYTTISPFYANMVNNVFDSWGIPGYSGNAKKLWGVIFFHDGLKNAYKKWVETLYTASNPYTGVPLKDEPAVALIQTQNEDGVFFYTISAVNPEINKLIQQKYYNWLVKKYQSIAQAQIAWGNVTIAGDNTSIGEMGLYIIWEGTQNQSGGKQLRLTDQIEFFAETQRGFYQEMYDHFREIGCKQLVNGSNWKAADAIHLLDVERWTNSTSEVIALNRYYSPTHIGENSAWRIDPGHYFEGKSVLLAPEKLPINIKQPTGHPVVVTESGWNLPHKYQAEGPFLISAYMSLTGVDAFYWFSPTTSGYDPNPFYYWTNLSGGQHPLSRWSISIPGQMAMFPANALTYRLGYIAESTTLVTENRTLQSIYKREIPLVSEDTGFDPNRDTYLPSAGETELSPVSFLAGKIQVQYNDESKENQVDPVLSSLTNFQSKKITSQTGELVWDYKEGICTMNSPSAQGICGFVGKTGTFSFQDVKITTQNEYATINVVSMDKKSLVQSDKILIQVGTTYRPKNWSETATEFTTQNTKYQGFQINNTGQMPWMAAQTLTTVTVRNKGIQTVWLLDVAGYPVKSLSLNRAGDEVIIELPNNAMYVVLQSDKTTGLIELNKRDKMKIYPNPSDGKFKIEITADNSASMNFELVNELGQKIYEKQPLMDRQIEFNLRNYPSGVYFAKLKDGQRLVEVKKFILKN